MSGKNKLTDRDRSIKARRRRDFIILTLGAVGVMALLFATNAIGLVEWITGVVVMLAGSLAFYVGSLPAPAAPPAQPIPTVVKPTPTAKSTQAIAPFILSMPFPALLVGRDNRLQTANTAAKAIFRIKASPAPLITAALRQPDLLDAIERISQSGAGELIEFSLRDDEEIWMAHMQAGPEPGSVIIVFEDMTAVRRAERARADFLANASHELRTPLTALGGFIETMRGPAKDDKESWDGFLEIMQQQTERMKRLVADLLSLSRIEFSEHRSPSTRIDAIALVSSASLALQPMAEEAGVTLNLVTPDDPVELIADSDEITQVLQNLVSNAIKYVPKDGMVTITLGTASTMASAAVACAQQMPDANQAQLLDPRASSEVPALWLRVEDNGTGIQEQHLRRLGERFYRTDESRGGKIEGIGLGLAIVKHIMARHRGGLAVESVEDEGTAFGVWMPLAIPRT